MAVSSPVPGPHDQGPKKHLKTAHNPLPHNPLPHNPLQGQTISTATEQAAASHDNQPEEGLLARTARLFGTNIEEARSLDKVDNADVSVERIFDESKKTVNSPAYRAVWRRNYDFKQFQFSRPEVPLDVQAKLVDCLSLIRQYRDSGVLYGADGKIPEAVLKSLGPRGYWGALVSKEYGGMGLPFQIFTDFLEKMAQIDPTVAGLASIHGCIGAVDPLQTFGTKKQKESFLPLLAGGEKLSAFALTEPNAGSDLTALRTKAELVGDQYIVNGEKLFISNTGPDRIVGLVCLIEKKPSVLKPSVLIVQLPEKENENFYFKDYGIYALQHLWNRGMIFKDFAVPKENLLEGDGLTIAYHGLNRGRISLCANAAGCLAALLADIVPWGHFRETYRRPIGEQEIVEARMGHCAAYMIGCRAMAQWCASLLDQGYRGELECIGAKNLGARALAECSIWDIMKTHGGRSFLKGHPFGDNIHDLLAPSIYEGEEDMLSMAFFKSMAKEHGVSRIQPWAEALGPAYNKGEWGEMFLQAASHGKEISSYLAWKAAEIAHAAKEKLLGSRPELTDSMPDNFRGHFRYAASNLQQSALKLDRLMLKYAEKLPERQLVIVNTSRELQKLITICATAAFGSSEEDPNIQLAADVFCLVATETLKGRDPLRSSSYRKSVLKLGKAVYNGEFSPIDGLKTSDIMQPYEKH